MTKKWYFKYNPTTFEFIPGAIRADEQPENTTTVEPTGFYGLPKWNPSTNSWTGQSIGDYLAKQKANEKQQLDPNQQALANLSARITALENERKENDV